MSCGDPVKLGDRLGVAAGEQARPGAGHGHPQEIEGVTKEHQTAARAAGKPAEEVAERLVVGELIAESRPARPSSGAAAEVEVADDHKAGAVAHRSITRSIFSSAWPATAPARQRVRYTTTVASPEKTITGTAAPGPIHATAT